jgi:hypothetical protein
VGVSAEGYTPHSAPAGLEGLAKVQLGGLTLSDGERWRAGGLGRGRAVVGLGAWANYMQAGTYPNR